jgi:hypothetical protein
MTRRIAPVAVLLAATLAAPAGAQTPRTVGVRAELAAPRYRAGFAAGTGAVEDSLSALFADLLRGRIGFVRFAATDTTSHSLVFTLDRRDRSSTGPFAEYGFWARLDRAGADPIELYWLPVRPSDAAWQGIGTSEEFLFEVAAKLEHADIAPIRDQLLSRVPIATNALPWAQPAGWALPLGRDALCMRAFSEIEIINSITVGAMRLDRSDTARVVSDPFTVASPGPREQPYLRKLFGTPISAEGRQQLIDAVGTGSVLVTEVFVVKYQHDPNACERPIPPFGGGGG